MRDVLYINGRYTTTDERLIGVEDRGFQFGDGVYEVLKFLGRRLLFAGDHFQRMSNGLAEIEIPTPWSEDGFLAMGEEILRRTSFDEGTLYVQVTRGEAERAHFPPAEMKPTALAYSRRFPFPDAARKAKGIAVITTPDTRWHHCNVKSINLLGNVLAKKKAQKAGAQEALFVRGTDVTEGASSTFFGVAEERLITHPADHRILPGTVRNRLIELATEKQIRVDERPLREDELLALDEAFITSTSQAVMPVVEIDARPVAGGLPGPLTLRLQALFDELERREAGLEARAE